MTDLMRSERGEIGSLGFDAVARIEVKVCGRIEGDARRQTPVFRLSVWIGHSWKQSKRAHRRNLDDHSRSCSQIRRQLLRRQRVIERGLLRASRASNQSGANYRIGVFTEAALKPRMTQGVFHKRSTEARRPEVHVNHHCDGILNQ